MTLFNLIVPFNQHIRDAPSTELSTLNQDSDFIQIMSECGETQLINVRTLENTESQYYYRSFH